jgi:CRISPR-associated protein (TIGR03986 family)
MSNSQVHAPYHFVPLSKWVYMPDWAHLVSHDVPFKDGYSGVIDYTLTNATPLLVGGDQHKEDGQPTKVMWARDPHGNPVIPGSSIKGMLRSVMEIATFGKFSGIDDHQMSFRDVSAKKKGTRHHYLDDVIGNSTIKAAWVKFNIQTGQWELSTCKFAKVKHQVIKDEFKKTIKNASKAEEKYKELPLKEKLRLDITIKDTKKGKNTEKVAWATNLGKGKELGHFVFCHNRIKGPGKPDDYEFSYCFYGKPEPLTLEKHVINKAVNDMFQSHTNQMNNLVSYLQKNPSPELGIPVFALFKKGTNKLHSLGLARMPRVLYQHAANDLADYHQGKCRTSEHYFDMSELIFGTLRDKGMSLKSRISLTDATLSSQANFDLSKRYVLSSPKPSFLGAYLEQEKSGEYSTYDQRSSKLSGWKRYIVKPHVSQQNTGNDNADTECQMEFLSENTQFKGKLVFHNLKKEELGALLWCLKLGNREGVYHSLGHGKSIGAGAVSFNISFSHILSNDETENPLSLDDFINAFTDSIKSNYFASMNGDWIESPQIQHLMAISDMQGNSDRNTEYNQLSDFKNIKNQKEALNPMELDGRKLHRREPTLKLSASTSFAKGRLADLISDEDNQDTWFIDQQKQQKKMSDELLRERRYQEELALKAQEEKAKQDRLDSIDDPDLKQVIELITLFEESNDVDAKRLLNTNVEKLLDSFVTSEVSQEAAEALAHLIANKQLCEYLNITNKKKLKPRKQKETSLKEKYGLSDS